MAKVYTLSEAAEIRFSLIHEIRALLHCAALNIPEDEVAKGIIEHAPDAPQGSFHGSHNLSGLTPLVTELVDLILSDPETLLLEPGTEMTAGAE